jgi:hypothetical protein
MLRAMTVPSAWNEIGPRSAQRLIRTRRSAPLIARSPGGVGHLRVLGRVCGRPRRVPTATLLDSATEHRCQQSGGGCGQSGDSTPDHRRAVPDRRAGVRPSSSGSDGLALGAVVGGCDRGCHDQPGPALDRDADGGCLRHIARVTVVGQVVLHPGLLGPRSGLFKGCLLGRWKRRGRSGRCGPRRAETGFGALSSRRRWSVADGGSRAFAAGGDRCVASCTLALTMAADRPWFAGRALSPGALWPVAGADEQPHRRDRAVQRYAGWCSQARSATR